MIYRAMVASLTRKAFADLSAGRIDRHLGRFASNATLRNHDALTGGGMFGGASLRDGFALLDQACGLTCTSSASSPFVRSAIRK